MTQNRDHDIQKALQAKNERTALFVLGLVALMIGLSFASVPLYNVFCRVTGLSGTTQVSEAFPDEVLEREITIRFDANTSRDLLWDFYPEVLSVDTQMGARGLANFIAVNKSDEPVAGTAVFNVTPLKAGKYFNKVQCFCFDEQILQPGQRVNMPVLFYVDPKMNDDKSMDDVSTITLSYSFFKTDSQALEMALEDFYDGNPIQK